MLAGINRASTHGGYNRMSWMIDMGPTGSGNPLSHVNSVMEIIGWIHSTVASLITKIEICGVVSSWLSPTNCCMPLYGGRPSELELDVGLAVADIKEVTTRMGFAHCYSNQRAVYLMRGL